jgi:hypothetical protein
LWERAFHNHLSTLNPSLLVTLTLSEVERKNLIDELE